MISRGVVRPDLRRLLQRSLLAGLLAMTAGCDEPSTGADSTVSVPGVVRVPADEPTIQAGIDAAGPGEIVLLADGVYTGPGNRDLQFGGKSIVLTSENGAAATIIDCRGEDADPHFGFRFGNGDDRAVLRGLTVRRAVHTHGAAISCESSSPTIIECVLTGNRASVSGGALRCKSASPRLVNCTLAGNSAPAGGAVFALARSSPRFENCIIAFSEEGGALSSDSASEPVLTCCNLHGNEGGDWVGPIEEQAGTRGNMSVDPFFCDPMAGDYSLCDDSPCVAERSRCGILVGALGPGCGACGP